MFYCCLDCFCGFLLQGCLYQFGYQSGDSTDSWMMFLGAGCAASDTQRGQTGHKGSLCVVSVCKASSFSWLKYLFGWLLIQPPRYKLSGLALVSSLPWGPALCGQLCLESKHYDENAFLGEGHYQTVIKIMEWACSMHFSNTAVKYHRVSSNAWGKTVCTRLGENKNFFLPREIWRTPTMSKQFCPRVIKCESHMRF